jgi:hypothetical protein
MIRDTELAVAVNLHHRQRPAVAAAWHGRHDHKGQRAHLHHSHIGGDHDPCPLIGAHAVGEHRIKPRHAIAADAAFSLTGAQQHFGAIGQGDQLDVGHMHRVAGGSVGLCIAQGQTVVAHGVGQHATACLIRGQDVAAVCFSQGRVAARPRHVHLVHTANLAQAHQIKAQNLAPCDPAHQQGVAAIDHFDLTALPRICVQIKQRRIDQ